MRQMIWWALVLGVLSNVAAAEARVIEDFKNNPAARGGLVFDQVMGSANLAGGTICVGSLRRLDGSFGFDAVWRAPKDGCGWGGIGRYGAQVLECEVDAFQAAIGRGERLAGYV